ncbi:serine hydrolase domain-containing protein [Arenibaculum pallidiluteum]|uniref:serine hydrolase domain-containing protein n=1 Tax=Arenibaculum pallidiluteum TaxID=2812559 RepID=UPI001A967063|nr:serine hydrolase [Arenibaculum pallidiluteum]
MAKWCVAWVMSALVMLSLSGGAAAGPHHDWETGPLAEAGFDATLGDRLDAAFADGTLAGLHGVVVIRHGKLRIERYYPGADERWGQALGVVEHRADLKHDLRSVSKSVVGLLYGIALEERLVPPLDARLLEQFRKYPDVLEAEAKRAITIEHVLTMTIGLDWSEELPYTDPRNSEIAMELAPDRYRYILDRPMKDSPGERWAYNGGATALLGRLIAMGAGKPLLSYAREKLFGPLGIEDVEWVEGADGEPAAASGLRMRPRDLAKIGQLVLNGGTWDGRRIVSEAWLQASHSPHAEIGGKMRYGYHWWLSALPGGERVIAGFGNGGQRLFIVPGLDLVVVIAAGRYNQPQEGGLPGVVLNDFVLPGLN